MIDTALPSTVTLTRADGTSQVVVGAHVLENLAVHRGLSVNTLCLSERRYGMRICIFTDDVELFEAISLGWELDPLFADMPAADTTKGYAAQSAEYREWLQRVRPIIANWKERHEDEVF